MFTAVQQLRSKDQGAALILLLISIPALFTLLALAIDYSVMTTALTEARTQARMIALSALEEYYDDGQQTSTNRERLQRAYAAADQILQSNQILLGNQSTEPRNHFRPQDQEHNPDSSASLLAGRYFSGLLPTRQMNQPGVHCTSNFRTMIDGIESCNPCGGDTEKANIPCFNKIEDNELESPSTVITAFQVKGQLYPPLRAIFAKIFGMQTVGKITVQATAAISPRRIVALTDISRSVVAESHPPKVLERFSEDQTFSAKGDLSDLDPDNDSRGSFYAFYQDLNEPQVITTEQSYPSFYFSVLQPYHACMERGRAARRAGRPWPAPCGVAPNYDPLGYQLQWSFLRHATNTGELSDRDNTARNGRTSSQRMHYYDDYQKIQTVGSWNDQKVRELGILPELHYGCSSDDQSNCSGSETYAIDWRAQQGECRYNYTNDPSCQGPQPLSSLLGGLAALVDGMNQRRVSGDELGLIFFERSISWTRNILPTDNFSYLRKIVGPPPSKKLEKWREYTEAADLRAALKIFPSRDGATSILDALASGYQQLLLRAQRQGSLPARNELILITDGLSTCLPCSGSQTGLDRECFNLDQSADGSVGTSDYALFLTCQCNNANENRPGCQYLCALENGNTGGLGTLGNQCIPRNLSGAYTRYTHDLYSLLGGSSQCHQSTCDNSYGNYLSSITQIKALVTQAAPPELGPSVPVHVIAIGSEVGPNTVDIKEGNRCLTDAEARAPGQPRTFVREGCSNDCTQSFNNRSETNPFYQASRDLYEIAKGSGGEYLPLRPLADHCGGIPADPTICRTTGHGRGECLCYDNPEDTRCCEDNTVRYTDVLCRSKEQQINDFVESIISRQASFSVVDDQ